MFMICLVSMTQQPAARSWIRRWIWGACMGMWAVLLIAGLWPLNFNPKNGVVWVHEGRGIRFDGRGIAIRTPENRSLKPLLNEPAPVTIEFRIKPQAEPTGSLPQIISLYDGSSGEGFFVGQWKSSLIIRSGASRSPGSRDYRDVGIGGVLVKDREVFVTITSGNGDTSIFLNGALRRVVKRFSLYSAGTGDSGILVLGTAPSGKKGWTGIISGLAFYNRALSGDEVFRSADCWRRTGLPLFRGTGGPSALYLFDEGNGNTVHNREGYGSDLLIPISFRPIKTIFLEPNLNRVGTNRSFLSDVALNILGFIPFALFQGGLLLVRTSLRRPHACLLTVLLGSGLSLFIEMVQAYLPTRSSDLIDLICNILGSLFGVLLLLLIIKKAAPRRAALG